MLTVIKAGPGGYAGRGHVHPAVADAVRESAAQAREAGRVLDAYVARCGDDLALLVTHAGPPGAPDVLALGREAFGRAVDVAVRLGQHGPPDGRSNGGLVLERAEISFEERTSEPVLCFLADKAGPGAFNLPLYRMFADPFNTPTLLADPVMFEGFVFVVLDVTSGETVTLRLPGDLHRLLSLARPPGRHVVREVASQAMGLAGAVASTGEDPVLVVRCEGGFPRVGEALEPFAFPHAVPGWAGGQRAGPLMPVSTNDDASSRLDGPPRAIGLGFQVSRGRLVGPRDLLADRAFDPARQQALAAADYLRRHGPFAPGAGDTLSTPVRASPA